jgi:hypothetical protein
MKPILCLTALFFAVFSRAAVPDHALFTQLLADHVVAGRVDYAAMAQDERLDTYLAVLASTSPRNLPGEADRLAFWINAYNAYTLKLVADAYPIEIIHDMGTGGRIIGWLINRTPWDIRFAVVGGRTYTLNEIEHEIIRPEFGEPRIHFAIVCAAVSCPPLRSEAYTAARLDEQLNEQGRVFLTDTRHNTFDLVERTARISQVFSWFRKDFGANDREVIAFLSKFAPPGVGVDMVRHAPDWKIRHQSYDWSLNDR